MKYLTFNDKGIPPCLNDHIKHLIKKEKTFKKNLKNGRANSDYENLQIIRIDLTETVSTFKKNH